MEVYCLIPAHNPPRAKGYVVDLWKLSSVTPFPHTESFGGFLLSLNLVTLTGAWI